MGELILGVAAFILITMIGGDDSPKPGGSRDNPLDPKFPGTGPIKPGPNNSGPPPIAGPGGTKGWGGAQYGPGPVPRNFDWGGATPWISADCKTVAEPLLFLPIPGSHQLLAWWMPTDGTTEAQESLAGALIFVGPPRDLIPPRPAKGTTWGYVARMVHEAAQSDDYSPEDMATQIVAEAIALQTDQPKCTAADPTSWSPALRQWWESLVGRLRFAVPVILEDYDWTPDGVEIDFNP